MELSPFVESLRRDLAAAAAAGTEESRRTAELLGTALDSAVRLALLDAVSQAAAEITLALPGHSVEVRLRGRDPEIVVNLADAGPAPAADPGEGEATTARITLRLPDGMKSAVEAAAGRSGQSVNAWLVQAARTALEQPQRRPGRTSVSGYAQA